MCGRLQANTTDLWVLRYTWDIEEQREVIAGIVQEFVEQSGEDALKASHPRARNQVRCAEWVRATRSAVRATLKEWE